MSEMKRFIVPIVIVGALYIVWEQHRGPLDVQEPRASSSQVISTAFKEQKSGVQVAGEGVVEKVLPDDRDGSLHQRFILRLASGHTLLVAHNIELAPRIEALRSGDVVAFSGVYEWNPEGGVIHWTHHDPSAQHPGGWLKHDGQTFQ